MKRNSAQKTVVLGAGCAGLSAAWRLANKGIDVEVIESSSRVGGMASGVFIKDNLFDYGPHIFHSADTEILHDVKKIAGDSLLPFQRTIKIKFLDALYDFPLSVSDTFSKLPASTVIKAAASCLYHRIKGSLRKPPQENSETVLIRNYGKILYELFFKTYIKHVWGIEAKEFSPDFAHQRIPRLDLIQAASALHSILRSKRPKGVDTEKYVEKVEGELYTTRRGFSIITERMAKEILRSGGKITLNAEVKKLILGAEGRVESIAYEKEGVECVKQVDAVISTLPLNRMVHMIQPVPEDDVIQAADSLKFRSVVFVGILVPRKQVLPSSFMYFRNLSFNRITDLGYFKHEISPENATILIAEISCDSQDEFWKNDELARDTVLNELEREGMIKKQEAIECHVYRLADAYPMYLLNYNEALKKIFDYLKKTGNIQSIGRLGAFNYANSHVVMRMGYDAADRIAK